MTYYPLPDIPAGVTPDVRRFCEQVRNVVGKLEGFGQRIEVHQPFPYDPNYDDATFALKEFPVYRADVPVELEYATWTRPVSGVSTHDLFIYWRAPNGAGDRILMQEIRSTLSGATAWVQWQPKRFDAVNKGRRVDVGQLLTLEIDTENMPYGLLSLYLRRAEVIQ